MRDLHLTASLSILLQACTGSPAADLGRFDAGATMPARLGVDPHARTLRAGSPVILPTTGLTDADGPIAWNLTGPGDRLDSESKPRGPVTD